ncbi:MAG TPA: glycosyltransferase [Bacteroidota bacterium]|nr:glycosyltransferase [Bacteroidota bacterium]
MKILFLTSRLPYPPHRGDKLKIYNLIKNLSRSHEITLLSFIASTEEKKYLAALGEYCREIHTVYQPTVLSLWRCLLAVFSFDPFQIAYFKSRSMRGAVRLLLGRERFDIVHTHLIRMAQYTVDERGPSRVLDLTDAGSLYLERFYLTTRRPLQKLLVGWELKRLRRYEEIISGFDTALVCSSVDRDKLHAASPGANIGLLYNGVDLEYFSPDDSRRFDPKRIIYTGNLAYFPNVDGIRYFVRDILPLIRRDIPDVKLYIVGKDPPKKVRNLASDDIVVTGFVPDIRAEYLGSAVAVAPIRFGAGTLNKVLEPMALGVPVVSTPIGAEGLPFVPGKHLMIGKSPEEFAAAVVTVLNDPALRQRLSLNGRDVVGSKYGWDVIAGALGIIYKNLLLARS